ncbi:alpha/beta hydrolase [Pseudomonas sp. RIT-PI-q]|uniref:alpha/beta fold hydrolase n=1 Tax=Pseudomonas sp. RIT-PI-q TaxID=1690247 RepID=UPI0006CE0BA6|nr:alpha/beta hydrolase [Pseudomonas sp. RIT-PI-q]KPG96009.1 alpha/beta hydrolase [Pseudomonas sp. RIT-PI-q]
MNYSFVSTPLLKIGYLEWNRNASKVAVLVHGWPDSPETWLRTAGELAAEGYRVLAPALRGFAPTTFRRASTPRSGALSTLGMDLLGFIDAMELDQPVLVGHDWGARAVANACGLRDGVASALVMLSVGYGTNDPNQVITMQQARNYWYHWFMATPRGRQIVESDRSTFARMMWDTWSPAGWYKEEDFETACEAFKTPDWAEVVLHSYRHRWGFVDGDLASNLADTQLTPVPTLSVPTLVLHGEADSCNHPDSSKGKESFFSGHYERVVVNGVGHFPQREAPELVAFEILRFLKADSVTKR